MLVILQMYKIGLTGGIASGKSTVADMLDKQNLIVIDTDKIAWQLAEPHGSLWEAYRGRYGDRVINADNTLNRQAVATIAFSDKGEKAWMDGMAHPLIWAEVAKRLQRLEEHGLNVAFVDVPLLFESGYLAAPYPKLFRLDVICRNKLRFDPRLKINEDVLFNLQYLRFLLFLQKNSAIYCLAGVYYNQNDMLAGSLSRSLRGDLLDAEAVTRPVLEAFLTDAKLPAPEIDRLVQISRVRAALNQYGLLTGCPGRMPFAQRRQLFARILQDADARAALRARLTADPNRLLALPYRLGVFLHSAWLLAAYTQLKNRFL